MNIQNKMAASASLLNIEYTGAAKLILHQGGIQSTTPADITSEIVDGVLHLKTAGSEGYQSLIIGSNIIFGGTGSLIINGQQISLDGDAKAPLKAVSIYETSWEALGFKDPVLSRIRVNGPGEISIEPLTLHSSLSLSVQGSGSITFVATDAPPEQVKSLNLAVSGSGSIGGSLEAQIINANVSGSGHISYLRATMMANATVSGSGRVELFVGKDCEHISNVSGSGKIQFYGSE